MRVYLTILAVCFAVGFGLIACSQQSETAPPNTTTHVTCYTGDGRIFLSEDVAQAYGSSNADRINIITPGGSRMTVTGTCLVTYL